jgi:hypothetical protein
VLFPTGFRELARIGQPVPQKMCTKAGYQEIFAEFVEDAKPSEAQLYSIKPLHKDPYSKPGRSPGSVVRESTDSFDERSWDWKLGTMRQIIQLPIVQIRKLLFQVYASRHM